MSEVQLVSRKVLTVLLIIGSLVALVLVVTIAAIVRDDRDALISAIRNCDSESLDMLRKKSVQINTELVVDWDRDAGYGGTTTCPFILMAVYCDCGMLSELHDLGADVNRVDGHGSSALTAAIGSGRTANVRCLLELGVSVDPLADDKDVSASPLMAAAMVGYHGDVTSASLLIEDGADVNYHNSHGDTALIMAAWAGSTDVVELLVRDGADVDWQNDQGLTAVMTAASEGHDEIVEMLINHHADFREFRKYNRSGLSALHLAAEMGHESTIRLLVGLGMDVNLKAKKGPYENMRPLTMAISEGHIDAAKVLLELGAEPTFLTFEAMADLDEDQQAEVEQLLRDHFLDKSSDRGQDSDGNDGLMP